MIKGFQSESVTDALTRRALYVERAKTALHSEYDVITAAILNALLLAVGKLNTRQFGTITRTELKAIVQGVLRQYDSAALEYTGLLTTWLEEYTNQEGAYFVGAYNEATEDEDVTPFAAWPWVAASIIGATGMTIQDTLVAQRKAHRDHVIRLIQRAYAQKWTTDQLVSAFRGTRTRKEKDGLAYKMRRGAEATVDTVVQFSMSSARLRQVEKVLDHAVGYTWVSILDGRTSAICRSLSGKVFEYGKGPVPPMHYRCRSHIVPIFRKDAPLTGGASKAADTTEQYYSWLKRQPEAFQDDVLGPTWSKLFRNGGLSPEEFAAKVLNKRYEPLTLKELRKKFPEIFNRAGL